MLMGGGEIVYKKSALDPSEPFLSIFWWFLVQFITTLKPLSCLLLLLSAHLKKVPSSSKTTAPQYLGADFEQKPAQFKQQNVCSITAAATAAG
jgi:hypothetical protein